ncbi:MAG TPA: adenylate/guanylate cyclase domain-containing protein [Candidatus Nitrosotenuis sp.]
MEIPTPTRLFHAHFLFVDIVGLSDPSMSTKTQVKKIETLNKSISETTTYKNTPKDTILVLPTGDGMCLGFLQGPELPLHLAIDLHKKLDEYNKGKIPSETVRIRIGLHSGSCFIVKDIRGYDNVWGPGTIISRRVMDFGDDGHILLSTRLAEDLRELSDEYRKIIKPVHDFTIKHGQTMLVYSAYGPGFGNPQHPTKGAAERSKYGEEILKMQKTALYPNLEVHLTITDPEKMLTRHKRTYEVANISDEPIKYVLHGIATDVEKYSINDLNLQVLDDANREMRISSINVDKPTTKEFTTQFNRPVVKGEKDRKYTLVYEVEEPERYFENAFLIDVQKFSLVFEYPKSMRDCQPIIYYINQETDEKTKSEIDLIVEETPDCFITRYNKAENLKGETLRLEW